MADLRVVVRGEDFTLAAAAELGKIQTKVHEWYGVKARVKRYIGMSCRTLSWTADEELEYEANQSYWQEWNTVSSAAVKAQGIDSKEDEEFMETGTATTLGSLAATLNGMSMDRPIVQYAAKELCSQNGDAHAGKLEETGESKQILDRSNEVTWEMQAWDDDDDELKIDVQVDADWAKGKSTNGGVMMVNGTVDKH